VTELRSFQPSHFTPILGDALNMKSLPSLSMMKFLTQLKNLAVRTFKVVFQLIVFGAILVIGGFVLGKIIQWLPGAYQVFAANAQAVVGLAEVIVAGALILTVSVEVLNFLLKDDRNTMTTLTTRY
jgi:hypothetical protein